MTIMLKKKPWLMKPPMGTPIRHGHPLASAIVSAWMFNEGGGINVYDVMAYQHGVITNPTNGDSGWAVGPQGEAFNFDGDATLGSYVDLGTMPLPANNHGVTMLCRASLDDHFTPADIRFISKALGSSEAQHVWMLSTSTGNSLRMRLKAGGTTDTLQVDNVLTDFKWIDWVGTYDEVNMRLYMNGVLKGSPLTHPVGGPVNLYPATGVNIGRNPGNDYGEIDGQMQHVYLWSRGLLHEELIWVYERPYDMFVPKQEYYIVPAAITGLPSRRATARGILRGVGRGVG